MFAKIYYKIGSKIYAVLELENNWGIILKLRENVTLGKLDRICTKKFTFSVCKGNE
jgi:hypothetical protein